MEYREIKIADLEALFKIRISTRENRMTMKELAEIGITPSGMREMLLKDAKGWLCEEAGEIVGFAIGNKSSGEMMVVAIMPEYEGKGIGKHLLALVTEWLFSAGHNKIWLLANPDPDIRAYGFYRKLGWVATGEMKDDDEVMILKKDYV